MKVAVLEKLLGMRQVLKVNELMDRSPQSKNRFKSQMFTGDKKNPICGGKKSQGTSCKKSY